MAIPRYQEIMLPLMETLQDQQAHTLRELDKTLADKIGLTEEERQQWYPSGNQRVFNSRLSWAGTYLKKAGLINREKGSYSITKEGLKLMATKPSVVDNKTLEQYQSFMDFKTGDAEITPNIETPLPVDSSDPITIIEEQYELLQMDLKQELLAQVKNASPSFFEELVVQLLFKMGYGGSHQELQDAVVGKPGDGGIDGIIKEDKLGLDKIHIQAKRYDNRVVGREELQAFVGSMHGVHATKGVFFTTSTYANTVKPYIGTLDKTIVLIDGSKLVSLMLQYNVGVAPQETYTIQHIDHDFFVGCD